MDTPTAQHDPHHTSLSHHLLHTVHRYHCLGSSISSEPRGLAGLSVTSHAGVLTRSKISESLLHRLSRPWHSLGPRGSHRDQRYGASPQIFFACGGRLLIRIDPSHAQQSPPQHPPLPILVALLERNLQAKQFSQIASSSNKRMSRKPVYAGPL